MLDSMIAGAKDPRRRAKLDAPLLGRTGEPTSRAPIVYLASDESRFVWKRLVVDAA
jgi:hypothetical protein